MKHRLIKKILAIGMITTLLLGITAPVFAQENSIKVQLNGQDLAFDVKPQIIKDRTMVPLRGIFEKLGAKVSWEGKTQTITATKAATIVKLKLNSKSATVIDNGVSSQVQLDAAPLIIKDRTLVPIRFISESLGKHVGWDYYNRTVVIIDYDYFVDQLKTKAPNFSEFINNKYQVMQSGEISGDFNTSFSLDSGYSDYKGGLSGDITAKLNPDNGLVDTNIDITELRDLLKGTGLDKYDTITSKLMFDTNAFYLKSNLFKLFEENGMKIGDKWVKANISELNIPDVKTTADLKKKAQTPPAVGLTKGITKVYYEPDIYTFKNTQDRFDTFVKLVDDEHFTKTINGDVTTYKWHLTKQDILNIILDYYRDEGSLIDTNPQQLLEMQKMAQSLVFAFDMQTDVKNHMLIGSKVDFDFSLDTPYSTNYKFSFNGEFTTANINGSSYNLEIPNAPDVINYKDLKYSTP